MIDGEVVGPADDTMTLVHEDVLLSLLYAGIGDEDNRNRRPAEWDSVIRKLMTVDFVLAHRAARFLATEEEKEALLRARVIPSVVWPHRTYAPRPSGGRTTTRYFGDKMPWYQEGEDDRIWIAFVDAERTLQGFETFLNQDVGGGIDSRRRAGVEPR